MFEASPPTYWTAALIGVFAGAALAWSSLGAEERSTGEQPELVLASPIPSQWLPRPQPDPQAGWSLQAHQRWAEISGLHAVRCDVGELLPDRPVVAGEADGPVSGGIDEGELLLVVPTDATQADVWVPGTGSVRLTFSPGAERCDEVTWVAGSSSVFGRVVDPSGAPMAQVSVSGCGAELVTEHDGSFLLEPIAGSCGLALRLEQDGLVGTRGPYPLELRAGEDVELTLAGPDNLRPYSPEELVALRDHLDALWRLQEDMERKLVDLGRDPELYDHLLVETIEPLEARLAAAEAAAR